MRRTRPWCVGVALLASAGCEFVLGEDDRRLAVDAAVGCPADMVEVTPVGGSTFCIDAYEASHDPADATKPVSVAGATPWTDVDHDTALAACAAVGKRLCQAAEVVATCAGPAPGTRYPYGDAYQPQACNGWDHGVGDAVPTGSMPGCVGNAAGVFDLQGNVEEWLQDCGHDGSPFLCGPEMYLCCKVLPGSYKSPDFDLDCQTTDFSSLPEQARPERGFRCCQSR
ncbi:MAG: SUMF1/EgtB/PvdO family nonheme iron enzyme [Myxococcales bacterium]|nr:SUMF1/EgtB/PvdO family nonheme iron enzyme [Myxococcales bacterium]MBK7193405.1 SUMF1/EgtB/PvdO family nonheme iron enzyme [Myxococcales bacterium]MBP6844124.1 SUMF1/EgtB/PvdO family nonheme iron enzyme [Kofleriaceae bacterium]